MHYLLFYDYVENAVERRAPFREEHLRLAREAVARGELLLGGAFAEPVDGAALLFQADDPSRRRGLRPPRPLRRERRRHPLAHPALDGGRRRATLRCRRR